MAVIAAMLTVALVATLAAAVVATFGQAIESSSGRHDLAQARWLARGTIDRARNVLAEDKRTTKGMDYIGEAWSIKIPPTPVEGGEVGGEIEDQSGLFNLNSLVDTAGSIDQTGIEAFSRLLQSLSVPRDKAATLANNLAHWIDASRESVGVYSPALQDGGAKPPNATLTNPDELSGVPGFDSALVERLRPFITALPPGSTLNLNTATPEVIASTFPGLTIGQARSIATERAAAWFKDLPDFDNRFGQRYHLSANPERFAVGSRYFLASGRAHFGSATTRMQVLLDRGDIGNRNNIWATIVWQRIL